MHCISPLSSCLFELNALAISGLVEEKRERKARRNVSNFPVYRILLFNKIACCMDMLVISTIPAILKAYKVDERTNDRECTTLSN